MNRTTFRSLAIVILALAFFLAHTAAIQSQSRPRRVNPQPTPSPTAETRPRRVHQPTSVKLPAEAERFLDRLNKMIDQYLQPLPKQKQ